MFKMRDISAQSPESLGGEHIVVLGVGNILLKDEGVGVRVIEELDKLDLPSNVEVVDGGTLGLNLLPVIEKADLLIVVDVVEANSESGTIFRFEPSDIDISSGEGKMSLHQVTLLEVLKLAAMMGKNPRTVIFGIEPKEIDWGDSLSDEIKEKVPTLVNLVLEEIKGRA